MGPVDTWIIVVNMAGAILSALVNVASARTSPSDWKPLRYTVAILASLYVAGYVTLLVGWLPLRTWGTVFRGLSIFVWPIVWAGPPIQASRMWRTFHHLTQGQSDGA